jgi:hypothetical protein
MNKVELEESLKNKCCIHCETKHDVEEFYQSCTPIYYICRTCKAMDGCDDCNNLLLSFNTGRINLVEFRQIRDKLVQKHEKEQKQRDLEFERDCDKIAQNLKRRWLK